MRPLTLEEYMTKKAALSPQMTQMLLAYSTPMLGNLYDKIFLNKPKKGLFSNVFEDGSRISTGPAKNPYDRVSPEEKPFLLIGD